MSNTPSTLVGHVHTPLVHSPRPPPSPCPPDRRSGYYVLLTIPQHRRLPSECNTIHRAGTRHLRHRDTALVLPQTQGCVYIVGVVLGWSSENRDMNRFRRFISALALHWYGYIMCSGAGFLIIPIHSGRESRLPASKSGRRSWSQARRGTVQEQYAASAGHCNPLDPRQTLMRGDRPDNQLVPLTNRSQGPARDPLETRPISHSGCNRSQRNSAEIKCKQIQWKLWTR